MGCMGCVAGVWYMFCIYKATPKLLAISPRKYPMKRLASIGRPPNPDVISVLEAIYQVEQSREQWLSGVLSAAFSTLNYGKGVGMVLYDASQNDLRVDGINSLGPPCAWMKLGLKSHRSAYGRRVIGDTYRSVVSASSQKFDDEHLLGEGTQSAMTRFGIGEQWLINGVNPSGTGCALYLWTDTDFDLLTATELTLLERLAVHLASGYRLQRRLAGLNGEPAPEVEAVLKPGGGVEHADKTAQSKRARSELADAVQQREWARHRAHRDRQDSATATWKGLVGARWTLVDTIESDGKRYVLARENLPARGSARRLSVREQQVAALVGLGHSNKLIAYELGLAHSTVRVLLARAAAKLGVSSRDELGLRMRNAGSTRDSCT
jgi:DNA-binding CsgD family transcriptional regulator